MLVVMRERIFPTEMRSCCFDAERRLQTFAAQVENLCGKGCADKAEKKDVEDELHKFSGFYAFGVLWATPVSVFNFVEGYAVLSLRLFMVV